MPEPREVYSHASLTIAMLKKNNYTEVWYLLGQQLILVIGFDMYGKAVLI
jgi:hypothetical protein